MTKNKVILFLFFIFFIVLQFLFSLETAPLSDDINHYLNVINLQNGNITTYDTFSHLFNDPNRYTRPVSPIILGTMEILSLPSKNIFFLWGIFYIGYIYVLYKIIIRYFDNHWFALLTSILILLFPLSSTNLFSPVMQSVQSVVGFFLIPLLLCSSKKISSYIFMGVLTTASLLLYELNLFLLPITVGLIILQNNEKRVLKLFLAIILPIIIAFSYKLFFVKLIYPDYFDYSSSKIILGLDRIKEVSMALIKLFTTDSIYIVIKSFEMISFYSIWDFILVLLGAGIAILTAVFIKPNNLVSRIHIGILILFFLMTIFVFFISNYPPIAFGFENRILLWVRISSSLLFAVLLNNLLFLTKSKKVLNTVLRFGIFTIVFSGIVSVISQKNSWVETSKYNEFFVKNLDKTFPDNQEKIKILYVLDKNKRAKLITDEATAKADYEIASTMKLYTNSKFNPHNIVLLNPSSYSLYKIRNFEFNKRLASQYILTNKGITIGKRELNYPFYIFDERDNSVKKVEHKNQFIIK